MIDFKKLKKQKSFLKGDIVKIFLKKEKEKEKEKEKNAYNSMLIS